MAKRFQKITPFLWFDHQAEEAVNFYISIFEDSRMKSIARYREAGPGPKGSVMTIAFELAGQEFVALNGGPHFQFTEAISFVVNCETQKEIDRFWEKLLDGGTEIQCGWLKDKYGLAWQIVPTRLFKMLQGGSAEASLRATKAMFQMKKLDLAELERAYRGES